MFLLVVIAYKTCSIFSPTHIQKAATSVNHTALPIRETYLRQRGKMHLTLLALALVTLLVASSAYVQPAGRLNPRPYYPQPNMARFQAEQPNYGGQDIAQQRKYRQHLECHLQSTTNVTILCS